LAQLFDYVPITGTVPDPGEVVRDFAHEQEAKLGLPRGTISGLINRGGVPRTKARLDHAFTLRSSKGSIIGAVQTFDQKQSRQLDDEYEIDPNAHGEVADIIGQNLTNRTLAVKRVDLYTDVMEEVFGDRELVMLTDQSSGFRLREAWRAPGGIWTGGQRVYEYSPVWFADMGRSLNTDGDRVSRANATLRWGNRQRVL